jgi:GT2 family glycosyltransferase
VDVHGNLVNPSMFSAEHRTPPSLDDLLSLKHVYFSIVSSVVVMRRSVFDACGGFDERLLACHDTHLWILAREHGPFFYLDERLGVRQGGPSAGREQWYVNGAPEFDRAVRARYGARYRGDLRLMNLLTAAAQAMQRHDRVLARQRYILALRYKPLRAKTYARLLLTFVPYSIAVAADRFMHPRIQARGES